MRRSIDTLFMVIVFGLVIQWIGCGGGLPKWALDVPTEPGYFHAVGVGQAGVLEMATFMAEADARGGVVRQVSYHLQQFVTAAGVVTTATSSGSISGATVEAVYKKATEDDSMYEVYVLIKVPTGQVKADVLATIKSDKDLYAKLKDSPKYKELVREVAEYQGKEDAKISSSG